MIRSELKYLIGVKHLGLQWLGFEVETGPNASGPGFSCGKTLTRNRTSGLEPLLTLQYYAYKYCGKINRRESDRLQRHYIHHCQLNNCPHTDEATVELTLLITPLDNSHLIGNGSPQVEGNIGQLGCSAQQLQDGETPITSGKGYPGRVPRVPKKNRGCPKGKLATKKPRRARRGTKRPASSGNVGS